MHILTQWIWFSRHPVKSECFCKHKKVSLKLQLNISSVKRIDFKKYKSMYQNNVSLILYMGTCCIDNQKCFPMSIFRQEWPGDERVKKYELILLCGFYDSVFLKKGIRGSFYKIFKRVVVNNIFMSILFNHVIFFLIQRRCKAQKRRQLLYSMRRHETRGFPTSLHFAFFLFNVFSSSNFHNPEHATTCKA